MVRIMIAYRAVLRRCGLLFMEWHPLLSISVTTGFRGRGLSRSAFEKATPFVEATDSVILELSLDLGFVVTGYGLFSCSRLMLGLAT